MRRRMTAVLLLPALFAFTLATHAQEVRSHANPQPLHTPYETVVVPPSVEIEPPAGPATGGDGPMAPAPDITIEGIDFDEDGAINGTYSIPPDPIGVAGPNHVVHVCNSSIFWSEKDGSSRTTQGLSDFFAPVNPATDTFDPKVIYDQHADRFVVTTIERIGNTQDDPGNVSTIFVAVSATSDPTGAWYFTEIDGKIFIGGTDYWADYPGLAVCEEAVYLTYNMFKFDRSDFGGSRLWIIEKGLSGGFYDGGAATVRRFNPADEVGLSGTGGTMMPAHTFGDPGGAIGTWLFDTQYTVGSDEALGVIRVDNPTSATPAFTGDLLAVGSPGMTSFPNAPQPGFASDSERIWTNDPRALHAVWRNNRLYMVSTVNPPSGPNAGQATAHYFIADTTDPANLTLDSQGDVGGEDIEAGAYTFFPSIAVNKNDDAIIGISLSGPNTFAGAYYVTLEDGAMTPTEVLAPGLAKYVRTFGGDRNRWGDYSGTAVDPTDDETFWVFNMYADTQGTAFGGENGRWAQRFGRVPFDPGTPPVADFTATPTSGDAPLTVQFSDASTNSPTSWSWDLDGDGVEDSASQNPGFTYPDPGTYDVTLTATNADGSDTETKTDYIIVAQPAPVAAFSATPTSGPSPLTVQFTDESANDPTNWEWDLDGDGTIDSTEQNPEFTYTEPGDYSVELTAGNAAGSDTILRGNYISVSLGAPIVEFSASPQVGETPLTVQFTDETLNNPTSWEWDLDGDGATDSTEQNPEFTYLEPGSYDVTLTATNATGTESDTKAGFISTDLGAPIADFAWDPMAGHAPLTAQFTDLSLNSPTSWEWDLNGDGTVDSTEQNPSYTYDEAGFYSVTLTATNAGGSDTLTVLDAVDVAPPPIPLGWAGAFAALMAAGAWAARKHRK